MDRSCLLVSFCDEWIEKFSNKSINQYQLLENNNFPNGCKSFGWITDDGESFKKQYNCSSYDEALKYIPTVTDVRLLGNLIFSYWRYFDHWAYLSSEILDNRHWFIVSLTRLKELSQNSIGEI